MSWQSLENNHPELAAFGAERLNGNVAYLATVRQDGSPRVHPVTPIILVVEDAAFPIGDTDDLGAHVLEQFRGDGADVAEALYGDACTLEIKADMSGQLARDDHHAASRRLSSP